MILVVDGSQDETKKVLEQAFPVPNFQVIWQQNRGRGATRNRGAQEANGALLVFFDDDMRPVPDCLTYHIRHHQRVARSILVGNQMEDLEAMHTDIQRYKGYLSRKWIQPLEENKAPLDSENLFLTAANFSISKQLFFELGGFDERLTDAEDFDLAVRANQTDISIYFDASALGWHDDWITCQSYIKRGRQYRQAHEKLKEIKPALYADFQPYAYKPVSGLKKMIYSLLARKLWVEMIDRYNLLLVFPRSVRYRFYDLIITGLIAHFPDRKI